MPMLSISEYMDGDLNSHSPFIITGVLKPKYPYNNQDHLKWAKDSKRNSKSQTTHTIFSVSTRVPAKMSFDRESCWSCSPIALTSSTNITSSSKII